MSIGRAHTTLYRDMVKQYPGQVSREISCSISPMTYDFRAEALRTATFGKQPDEELIARAYFQWMIEDHFSSILDKTGMFDKTEKQLLVVRKVIDKLSSEEVREYIGNSKIQKFGNQKAIRHGIPSEKWNEMIMSIAEIANS